MPIRAEKNTGLTAQDPDRRIRSLVINPVDPEILYIGPGAGVYKSTDGGLVWYQMAVGKFSALGGIGVGVTAAFDPSDEQTIYLGSFHMNGNNIRLRSIDGGASFSDISGPLGYEGVYRMRVSPHDSALLIAGMVGDGIEYSVDSGDNWVRHTSPPWLATAPGSFAQAPSDPQRIYLHGTYSAWTIPHRTAIYSANGKGFLKGGSYKKNPLEIEVREMGRGWLPSKNQVAYLEWWEERDFRGKSHVRYLTHMPKVLCHRLVHPNKMKSLKLYAPPGWKLQLFDSDSGSNKKNWAEVTFPNDPGIDVVSIPRLGRRGMESVQPSG